MTTLRLILADQLSPSIASLRGADKTRDVILLCEVMEEASYVPHHPKKIAFLFSAMRHFAEALQQAGSESHTWCCRGHTWSGLWTTLVCWTASAQGQHERVVMAQPL